MFVLDAQGPVGQIVVPGHAKDSTTAVAVAVAMTDVHTKQESIKIADLETAARLVETIIERSPAYARSHN